MKAKYWKVKDGAIVRELEPGDKGYNEIWAEYKRLRNKQLRRLSPSSVREFGKEFNVHGERIIELVNTGVTLELEPLDD